MSIVSEAGYRFYENHVKQLISDKFFKYENRIAVGLVGEGSDCFGYDDHISRDHDFGTGVCLWITDEDMKEYGQRLSEEYDTLIDNQPGNNLSARLRARRGVMTIKGFYSNILGIVCDTDNLVITEENWNMIDHNCLATAVNGVVYRDDLGQFSAFRQLLLNYYPDRIWKIRIVNELHKYASALQVNYARCMARGDSVAARLCHLQGLQAAMELFFLLKRTYPPYYKWTYRRLTEIDNETDSSRRFSGLIKKLSEENLDKSAWDGIKYFPNYINLSDPIIVLAERIAEIIVKMLQKNGFTEDSDPYLEKYVDEILSKL